MGLHPNPPSAANGAPTERGDSEQRALYVFLAAVSVFAIVYVSLEPFDGWSAPVHGHLSQLLRWSGLKRLVGFDALANYVAYIPLGFALFGIARKVTVAACLAGVVALSLEFVQTFLPTRHASLQDALINSLGAAAGAKLFDLIQTRPRLVATTHRLRAWLMPGTRGDYGVALLLVFLLAHLSPGLSFFSANFFMPSEAISNDPGLQLLQVLHTALLMTGFGLFADLVARTRLAGALLSMICVMLAIASKTLLAVWLLQSNVWGQWLSPAVVMGVLIGAASLFAIFWMTAAEKRIVCNVVLIVAVVLPVLAPEWLFARAPVRAFDWSYGHLLNFNSLSQTLLRLWPLFASAYLISTAGNPYQDAAKDHS